MSSVLGNLSFEVDKRWSRMITWKKRKQQIRRNFVISQIEKQSFQFVSTPKNVILKQEEFPFSKCSGLNGNGKLK